MEIGILTNTFSQTSIVEAFDAVRRHGIGCVQLELTSAGLAPLPDVIDHETAAQIHAASQASGVAIAAVSGTFNMLHPDVNERRRGLERLRTLAAACNALGTSVITLCSGTRDRDSMWRWHPDSYTDGAWRDLVAAMREAANIGETHSVTMAFEPEVNNAVDSARKARRLLDEVGSARLKVVMDGANIFHAGALPRMREVLEEAFEWLGDDIALAHAKDLDHDGDAGHLPSGHGLLDYDLYISLLRRTGFDGALILHGLKEDEVDGCVVFLKERLSR